MRREWLTALIREIRADSRGTSGRAACTPNSKGRGIQVSLGLVTLLMHHAGVAGLPGPARVRRIKGTPTADDLVERKFARFELDELWVTDITEHRTREGKVYCCAVMDTCSRRIVGWSIDTVQDAQLVVNALDMAMQQRTVKPARSCMPTTAPSSHPGRSPTKVHRSGLMPSFGSVGDAFDNAMMESFWSTMQIEFLNGKRSVAAAYLPTQRPSPPCPLQALRSSRCMPPSGRVCGPPYAIPGARLHKAATTQRLSSHPSYRPSEGPGWQNGRVGSRQDLQRTVAMATCNPIF
jgi:putative transposase